MTEDPTPITKGGVPLTDELADELAREAEAGYYIDPSRVRLGRKARQGQHPNCSPKPDEREAI